MSQEKDDLMKEAMGKFLEELSENKNVIKDIKYTEDFQTEVLVRIDFLHSSFNPERVDEVVAEFKDEAGNFKREILEEKNWNDILKRLDNI
jgi:hypothetical protein